jgi:hypothetical protein
MQKGPKILNYKNVSLEKYEYLPPHKAQYGNYQSICNYRISRNELLPFYFETPKLKTTSGIVRLDNKFYIDLELPQSAETNNFYQFLLKNDEHNITICHENSKDWFSNTMPLNIIESYYKTPILLKSNGQMPILRLHLPSYKGNILTELYNIRKEKINDILAVQEGDYIVGIVEFIGLSFLSQKFSPIYELQKIKIFKDNNYRTIPSGYIFSDINDKVDLNTIPITSNDKILEQPVIINKTQHNNLNEITKQPSNITQPNQTSNITQPTNIQHNSLDIDKSILEEPKKITVEQIKKIEMKNSTNDNNMNSDNKTLSLYEMIKNTTLKDIINDNNIFLQNTKFLNEAKQKRIQILEEFKKKQNNNLTQNKLSSSNILVNTNENNSNIQILTKNQNTISPTSSISIQDVKELNLDIDLNINNNNDKQNNTNNKYLNYDNNNHDNDNNNHDNDNNNHDNDNNNHDNDNNDNDDNDNDNDDNNNDSNNDDNNDSNNDNVSECSGISDDGINYDVLNDLEVVVFDE